MVGHQISNEPEMSSTDLKTMVMSFRVSELQVLLGFAGRSKSGKKHELMARAISLVEQKSSTPIEIKIRELYKRRFPGGPPQGKGPASSTPVKTQSSSPVRHAPYPGGITSGQPPGYSSSYQSSGSLLGAHLTGQDYNSRSGSSSSHHSQIPVHPDVRFKRLPFYDVMGELLKPSSLVPKNSSRFQETFFIFHLTPQQAQDIAMSRDLRPTARNEYTVQVQLRFCLLETSCPQKDEFPPSICVRVNGKIAFLPNPIPTNKPGVEPKRPSRPVNITSICRISPTVSNHISISWASELGRSYCVCVDLVRKLNADILLGRLKQKGTKHADHTRALIKEKLAQDPDSEIATTSLRVSLLCPLGKMRMTFPCRAHTCNHLQCFDAPTFLQMNEKKPTWQCPVCDREAEFDNLIVDGLFTEILKSAADATEIQFSEDGEWQPMKPKEKGRNTPEPITMISGDDTPTTSSSSSKKKEVDIIDLTESDDEDDMPEAIPGSPYSSSDCQSVISTKALDLGGSISNKSGNRSHTKKRLSSSEDMVDLSSNSSNTEQYSPMQESPDSSSNAMDTSKDNSATPVVDVDERSSDTPVNRREERNSLFDTALDLVGSLADKPRQQQENDDCSSSASNTAPLIEILDDTMCDSPQVIPLDDDP